MNVLHRAPIAPEALLNYRIMAHQWRQIVLLPNMPWPIVP